MAQHSPVETHVVDAEVIESLGDLNLLGGVEERVRKLLTLTKCGLDDLEARNIAQEVAYTRIWVVLAVRVWVGSGLNAGVSWVAYNDVVNSYSEWRRKQSDRLTAICSAGGAVSSSGWSSNLLRFARRAHIGVELKLIEVFVISVMG